MARLLCTLIAFVSAAIVSSTREIATLLLDLLRRNLPDARLTRFAFRATKPTFDTSPFQVCGRWGKDTEDGRTIQLWAQHTDGALAMDATATLA